jgi:threonine dehydrogenase-like Zn-dependent dehydrogenase
MRRTLTGGTAPPASPTPPTGQATGVAAAAAVCDGRGGLAPAMLAVPGVAAGEILLRLRCAGLCGTDLWKLSQGTTEPGAVLGHEVVGVVEALGDAAAAGPACCAASGSRLAPGDRLVVVHHVPCGACRFCRAGSETMCPAFRANLLAPGGFSELLVVRAAAALGGAFRLPPHLPDAAAVFLEPAACVLRGMRRAGLLGPGGTSFGANWQAAAATGDGAAMARDSGNLAVAAMARDSANSAGAGNLAKIAQSANVANLADLARTGEGRPVVAILGAGSMGLLHLLVLHALATPPDVTPPASSTPAPGAPPLVVLSDPLAERRALALRLGADAAAAPGEAMRHTVLTLTQGRGADLVFDTAGGAAPLAEALELGRPGSTTVLFAHAAAHDEPAAFPLNAFFKAERRLVATYSSAPAEQRAAHHLLVSGRLDPSPLVTHRLPLLRAAEAVDLATSHRALKLLLVAGEPGPGDIAQPARPAIAATTGPAKGRR